MVILFVAYCEASNKGFILEIALRYPKVVNRQPLPCCLPAALFGDAPSPHLKVAMVDSEQIEDTGLFTLGKYGRSH